MERPSILALRHAQSVYNVYEHKARQTGQGDSELRYLEHFIDCPISENGEKQALEAATRLKEIKIQIVFTSPLKRCLQTTRITLENHPCKPKVIVHPLLREQLFSCCDIPGDFEELEKEFPEFDWSLFEDYRNKKDIWHIETIYNESLKNDLLQEIHKKNLRGDIKRINSHLIKRLEEVHPHGIETEIDMFERVSNLKKDMEKRIQAVESEQKVMIVCHFMFLRVLTAKEFENKAPKNYKKFQNCEHDEVQI